MTLIINDKNKCSCGAYFESSGWCANGHVRIGEAPPAPDSLKKLTDPLKELTDPIEDRSEILDI